MSVRPWWRSVTGFSAVAFAVALVAGATLPATSLADDHELPVEIFNAVVLKSLPYDQNLEKRAPGDIVIAIVHFGEESSKPARQTAQAIQKLTRDRRIGGKQVRQERLEYDEETFAADISRLQASVIYVIDVGDWPERDLWKIRDVSIAEQALTVTNNADLVSGPCSFSVLLHNKRPKPVVHLGNAAEEGCKFRPSFLSLCKVQRRKR